MSFFSNLFNPPAANIPLPQYVSPTAFGATFPTQTTQAPTGNIDPNAVGGQYYSGVGNLGGYNTYGSLLPQAMGIGQGMVNDPSAFQYLQGAMTGSGLGTAAALGQYGAGANLYGLGGPTIATAFDPQNALYNQTLGQTLGQQMGSLYGAGLGTTPLGQSILGNTLGNFNINWQNAQQGRQLAGLQALSQLYPTAANLQGTAAPLFMQSAGMPWQAGQTVGGANLNTLGSLGGFGQQASVLPSQQLQDYMALMGWGTGAQQQAFNQNQLANFTDPSLMAAGVNQFNQSLFQDQLQQAQAASQEQAQAFGGLGRLAGGIGGFALGGPAGAMIGSSLFGGGGSPTGGGNMFASAPANFYQPFGGLLSGGGGTSSIFGQQYGGDVGNPLMPRMVGEEGPEMFVPQQSGTIIPNPQTQARMGGGFGSPGAQGMQMAGGGDGIWGPFGQPNIPPESGMGGLGGIGTFKPQFGRGWQYGGAG